MTLKSKNTRKRLLQTAITLFAKKGFANTSIREIGKRAEISTSIIYHYFKNKEEILFEIIEKSSGELIKELVRIQREFSNPIDCLREMLMTHMLHFSMKRKKEAQIVANDNHLLWGKHLKICRQNQRQIYGLYLKKLNALSKTGMMKDLDPTVVAFSIFGMINSFFMWYREGGRLQEKEVAKNILAIINHGILSSKEKCG